MTLRELSDAAGLGGRGNASNIERGRGPSGPRLDTLARIAEALDVPLASLVASVGASRASLISECRRMPKSLIPVVLLLIRQLEDE